MHLETGLHASHASGDNVGKALKSYASGENGSKALEAVVPMKLDAELLHEFGGRALQLHALVGRTLTFCFVYANGVGDSFWQN